MRNGGGTSLSAAKGVSADRDRNTPILGVPPGRDFHPADLPPIIEPMPDLAANPAHRRPRIIVLGAGKKPEVAAAAARVRSHIEQHTDVALWDDTNHAPLDHIDADWALVFGGDGSILRAANQMGYRQLPLLSVNLGKLGFLAGIRLDELPAMLPEVCAGRVRVVE